MQHVRTYKNVKLISCCKTDQPLTVVCGELQWDNLGSLQFNYFNCNSLQQTQKYQRNNI